MENQMNAGDKNTQQVGQNPTSQPTQIHEKPKINYWMVSTILLAIALIFGGLYTFKLDNTQSSKGEQSLNTSTITGSQANQPSQTPTQPTSTPPLNVLQTITLKVTQLKTGFSISGVTPTYPPSVTISVPQDFSDQLGAYGVSELTLVGPKSWTGDGLVGADGGGGANLYPIGGSVISGAHITVSTAPACVGCAYDLAAPYFPKARQWAQQNENTNIPEKSGLVSNFVTPRLLRYNLPNTADKMEVNGVAYFTESVSPELSAQPYFIGMEITLPSQQHNLAQLVLDIFIQRQNLNNK